MTKQAISNISTNSYDSKGSSYDIMPWFEDNQSHWIPPSVSTAAKDLVEHSRTGGKEESNGEVYQYLQPACRLGRFLPYGEQFVTQKISDWSTRYKFTGHERDQEIKPIGADSPNTIEINYEMRQTGFDYAHARYYNSDFSIFLSVDPLASMFPGISAFAYCYNNPIKFIDPFGLAGEPSTKIRKTRKSDQAGMNRYRMHNRSSGERGWIYTTEDKTAEQVAADMEAGNMANYDVYKYNRDGELTEFASYDSEGNNLGYMCIGEMVTIYIDRSPNTNSNAKNSLRSDIMAGTGIATSMYGGAASLAQDIGTVKYIVQGQNLVKQAATYGKSCKWS